MCKFERIWLLRLVSATELDLCAEDAPTFNITTPIIAISAMNISAIIWEYWVKIEAVLSDKPYCMQAISVIIVDMISMGMIKPMYLDLSALINLTNPYEHSAWYANQIDP